MSDGISSGSAAAALTDSKSGAPLGNAASEVVSEAAWYDTFPDELKGVVQNKGWKDPQAAIVSYRELERMLGADKASRGVVLPKDDADQEGWNTIYSKLGRPDNPEGYKLPIPEGDNGEFGKAAATKFHELGLSTKQATALAEWWNNESADRVKAAELSRAQASERELAELHTKWGKDYDGRIEAGRRAIREFGIEGEKIAKIEEAIGTAATLTMFAEIGKGLLEHPILGDSMRNSLGMSPEAARERIESLKTDKEFIKKYFAGDLAAKDEMNRLHRLAYS